MVPWLHRTARKRCEKQRETGVRQGNGFGFGFRMGTMLVWISGYVPARAIWAMTAKDNARRIAMKVKSAVLAGAIGSLLITVGCGPVRSMVKYHVTFNSAPPGAYIQTSTTACGTAPCQVMLLASGEI